MPAFVDPEDILNPAPLTSVSSDWGDALNAAIQLLDKITPIGSIQIYGGSSAPNTQVMICDGSAISRSTYSELFTAIGTTYGVGNGSTTFNIPNLKGKVVVGRDAAQGEFDTLGETGGEKTHTLTQAETPAHDHTYSGTTNSTGAHSHALTALKFGAGGSEPLVGTTGNPGASLSQLTDGVGNHNHTFSGTTSSIGSGAAHNNLQPYLVTNYIIRVL